MDTIIIQNSNTETIIDADKISNFKKTINNDSINCLQLLSKETDAAGFPRVYMWVDFDSPAIIVSADDVELDIDFSLMTCVDAEHYRIREHAEYRADYLNNSLKTLSVNLDHLKDFLMLYHTPHNIAQWL